MREADAFYARHIPATLGEGEQGVVRQAYASLLWSRKFFHYVVKDWLDGDPSQPPPPAVGEGVGSAMAPTETMRLSTAPRTGMMVRRISIGPPDRLCHH